jgi:citrate lyase subunit beta/citryl-CoA lyase
MPTKVSCAKDVQIVAEYMQLVEKKHNIKEATSIIPLIETSLGVENAFEIAMSCERVKAIFLGGEDLTADLRCKRTKKGDEIFYSRGRMVIAARAANIDVYDTPFTDVEDEEGLELDSEFAKSLGFTGKAVISPRHVTCVNEVFSPTKEDIEYAYEVMEIIKVAKEQGKGAISLRGKMIDAPIVERARQTIEMAEAIGGALNE